VRTPIPSGVGVFVFYGSVTGALRENGYMQEITVAELKARTNTPLIDVREQFEYADGHAPGAINIPMSELGARLEELPMEFDVICKVGGRSAQVAAALEPRGYDVTNVAGGTDAWIMAGYDVER